jgi:hypothetical protein
MYEVMNTRHDDEEQPPVPVRLAPEQSPPVSLMKVPEDPHEQWELLQRILPDAREQRLAYLLFHCGLSPREIVRTCPQEWSSEADIYPLCHTIMQRLLNNLDFFNV